MSVNPLVPAATQHETPHEISAAEVAELAVDLWKISERVRNDGASPRVIVACERAEDRLRRLGFQIDTLVGQSYDTNLRAKVVDHESGEGSMVIGRCISPAVFYQGVLVREAEVVTVGEEEAK